MAVSQNGYSANDRSVIGSYDIPGGRITLRKGDVSVVMLYVINRFHNEVEALVWPGNWGYAERAIRGSTATSNHASGTGIDLNAPRHPLGKVNTFNAAQQAKIRNILNFCEGVVRWGGDYSGRKDDMHFEINAGSAAVARIANKIRAAGGLPPVNRPPTGGGGGTTASADVKWIQQRLTYWGFPTTADGYGGPKTTAAIKKFQASKRLAADGLVGPKTRAALAANKTASRPAIKRGSTGQLVWDLQRKMVKSYPAYNKYTPNGIFGPATERGVKEFQRRNGLAQDGIVGPNTWRRLGF